jgi:transposase-like protein
VPTSSIAVGRTLANEFLNQRVGQGSGTLRKWLKRWMQGDRELPRSSRSFVEALSPESPTAAERDLVSARILDASGDAGLKRKRLADAVGRAAKGPIRNKLITTRV